MNGKTITIHRKMLWLILGVSLALRWFLVWQGGQFYFPDEMRYNEARKAIPYLISIRPNPVAAMRRLLESADHVGFKIVSMIPASVERFVGHHARIPAFFFSLFSVINMWLVWLLALKAGAKEPEALLAIFLLAISTTFFYYARHLLPYDLSMTFGLLCLLAAIARGYSLNNSLLCGFFASLTFLTYNGYWTFAALGLSIHLVSGPFLFTSTQKIYTIVRRSVFSGIGFLLPFIVVFGGSNFLQTNMLDSFSQFSNSITHGIFEEGWTFPFEYFWQAERFILPFWLLTVVSSVILFWQRGRREVRLLFWLWAIAVIYGSLTFFSVGLHKFVVYGRLVRQLVPFFCLMGAYSVLWMTRIHHWGHWLCSGLCALLLAQAGINFYRPLTQVYPHEFVRSVQERFPEAQDSDLYRLLYAQYIYPKPEMLTLPPHEILIEARHPAQYMPYLYEGFTPDQRHAFKTADIRMRFIRINAEH